MDFGQRGKRKRAQFSLAVREIGTETHHAMAWKRKFGGGILAFVGFMLSPLSWWNDLFVNVPLAIAFAWVISIFYERAFDFSVVLGYWLTNILGLVMMHKGAQQALSESDRRYSAKDLLKDLAISLLYTGVILLLLKIGILKPIKSYFPGNR